VSLLASLAFAPLTPPYAQPSRDRFRQYSTRADKGTQTSAKINVTVLLVELATKMDLAREQWLPAAKQHFLT
jgi:hypothetical protein